MHFQLVLDVITQYKIDSNIQQTKKLIKMNVLITLNAGSGTNIGPNLFLTSDSGSYSQVVTLTQLLNGLIVSVPDEATIVYVDSIGTCTSRLSLYISGLPGTTLAPTTLALTTQPPTTAAVTTQPPTTSGETTQPPTTSGETTSPPTTTPSYVCTVLGDASNFAVLGSSTVTNTGTSVITGDLGLSPGVSITGFPPGTLVGTEHLTDTAASDAQISAQAAYDCLSALTPISTLDADIGGTSVTSGVYNFASSAAITGVLTLNGQNNTDAYFVFIIPSTLVTATSSSVVLTNNAQPGNVYWLVGTSATLGTSTTMVGSIIADQSITMVTSATLDGRAFALHAAVTLDTNVITRYSCSINPCVLTPTDSPTTLTPTDSPTVSPTTITPTAGPTVSPTTLTPTLTPTDSPTEAPTVSPTTLTPTDAPTVTPTEAPTVTPTTVPPCETFCFQGIFAVGDEVHPDGGTVTYVDCDGNSAEVTGIFSDAGIVSIEARSITSTLACSQETCVTTDSPTTLSPTSTTPPTTSAPGVVYIDNRYSTDIVITDVLVNGLTISGDVISGTFPIVQGESLSANTPSTAEGMSIPITVVYTFTSTTQSITVDNALSPCYDVTNGSPYTCTRDIVASDSIYIATAAGVCSSVSTTEVPTDNPTTTLTTSLGVTVIGVGNNGTKVTSISIGTSVYVSSANEVVANTPMGDGRYTGSAVFDIDPADFGTKTIYVSWSATDLDYENSVNQIYMSNGGYFGGMGTYHYAPTTGSCSASTTIVAGNIISIQANLDNTI